MLSLLFLTWPSSAFHSIIFFPSSSLLSQTGLSHSHQNVSPVLRGHWSCSLTCHWDIWEPETNLWHQISPVFPPWSLSTIQVLPVTCLISFSQSYCQQPWTYPPIAPFSFLWNLWDTWQPSSSTSRIFQLDTPFTSWPTWGLDDCRAQLLLHPLERKLDTNFISKQGQQQVYPPSLSNCHFQPIHLSPYKICTFFIRSHPLRWLLYSSPNTINSQPHGSHQSLGPGSPSSSPSQI